jgi:hypothetical protein
MSLKSRKYKRIEALFSESPPAAPDSPLPAAAKPPIPAPPAAQPTDRALTGPSHKREEIASPVETPPPSPTNVLSVPLTVAGKTIGAVQAAGNEPWTGREIEIVNGVAAQLARHLEKLSRGGEEEAAGENMAA